MLWNSWVYFCVHTGGVFGARPPFLQKHSRRSDTSNCSFASITVSRHDGEHPFSSLQIIPFFSPLFFVRHHQSYFTLNPSEKASSHILVFTHSVCRCALIGLSIMHNLTASFCSEEVIVLGGAPPPHRHGHHGDGLDHQTEGHLIWILACFLIENKSAVKFKRLKIHDYFLGSVLFYDKEMQWFLFFPQSTLRHVVFITMAPLHRLWYLAIISTLDWASVYAPAATKNPG